MKNVCVHKECVFGIGWQTVERVTEPKKAPAKAPVKKPEKKPVKKKLGRDTKLTPERQVTILDALKTGCYVETACLYAGISVATMYNWVERGKRERERLTVFPDELGYETEVVFLEFLEAVEKARATAELRAVAQIQKAASEGTWQAASWYLERSAPKRWGRKDYTELTGEDGGAIRIDVATDELERKILEIASRRTTEIEE